MFTLFQTDDGHELPFEYLPCAAITPKYGMGMVVTGGKLAIASGANKPKYMCVRDRGRNRHPRGEGGRGSALENGELVLVHRGRGLYDGEHGPDHHHHDHGRRVHRGWDRYG